MSKELFNYLFDSNDNTPLEPESISIQSDLPRIPAPICPHLCVRHRLLRLNYRIASPKQSQIALCKKHLHTHPKINEEENLFSISNKNLKSISNITRFLKNMTDKTITNHNNHCRITMRKKKSVAQLLAYSFQNSLLKKEIYQSIFDQLYLPRSSSSILVNCGSDRRNEP